MTDRRAAVIGAGVMGAGIAQVMASAGWSVRCCDIDAAQLEEAQRLIRHGRYGLDRGVERGKLSEEAAASAWDRLSFVTSLDEAIADASIVVEAIPEDLGAKVRLFRDLDRRAPTDAILASNTSGLPIAAMAAATNRAHAVVGWHWASPVPVQRLAEIVVTPATSDATIAVVVDAATGCGKNPIVVKDQPQAWGFVVNRILAGALGAARSIVDEGVASREQVDDLLRRVRLARRVVRDGRGRVIGLGRRSPQLHRKVKP